MQDEETVHTESADASRSGSHHRHDSEVSVGSGLPPVSVVVAAHNEAETIAPLLASLGAQTHPDVEVIVVNDASTDGTAQVLNDWAADEPDRHVLARDGDDAPGKKSALAHGVSEASHDLFLFTDADCVPSPSWCERMAQIHETAGAPAAVVGYSPFSRERSLLNLWARYETMLTGALTAATAAIGHPYMAVGRNLSVHRGVYAQVRGTERGDELLSGDDDLFIQAVHRAGAPVLPTVDPDTFVETRAPSSWRSWVQQKRRHVSAGRAYDAVPATHLALYHGSHIALWIAPLVLGTLGIGLLATRLLVHSLVSSRAAEAFDELDLAAFFPVGEALLALYHVVLVPLGLLRPPDTWKR